MKTCLTALYIFPFAGNQRERAREKKERTGRKIRNVALMSCMHARMSVCMYVCVRINAIVSLLFHNRHK